MAGGQAEAMNLAIRCKENYFSELAYEEKGGCKAYIMRDWRKYWVRLNGK
jgi:hypothetical protein